MRGVIVLFGLLITGTASANYFTYAQWAALPEMARAYYISGAYDSLISIADEKGYAMTVHYHQCILRAKMINSQLAENVMLFAASRPELHAGTVQRALILYLIKVCGEPPKSN